MKSFFLCIILLSPLLTYSQKLIKLNVQQSTELGFILSRQDTSILKGESIVLGTDLIVFGGTGVYNYHWSPSVSLNDSTIATPVATPSDSVIYVLTVTDTMGCEFAISYAVNVVEEVVNLDADLKRKHLNVVLFPNPSAGKFKVQIIGVPSSDVKISIVDISGATLKQKTVKNFLGEHVEIFNLQLAKGIYMLKVKTKFDSLSRQFIIN